MDRSNRHDARTPRLTGTRLAALTLLISATLLAPAASAATPPAAPAQQQATHTWADVEKLVSEELQRVVDKQRRIAGQSTTIRASARINATKKTVIIHLDGGYVPKVNGAEFEDLQSQLMTTAMEVAGPAISLNHVDFRFDGRPITFYFPEDASPPRQMAGGGRDADPDTAAKSYMAHAGVSLEEARERLKVQSELDPHIERLRTQYAERLAFLIIEHRPDQHLRIGLKGSTSVPQQQINVAGTSVRVVFESGQLYTQQEFRAVMKKATPRILALFPDTTGISGRPERRAIEIHIQGHDTEAYAPAAKEIEAMTGLKVQFRPGMPRPRDLI